MLLEIIRNVTDLIMSSFDPHIPVVVALGNHDFWPVDQLPGEENAVYEAIYQMWRPWLNSSEMEATFTKGVSTETVVHFSAAVVDPCYALPRLSLSYPCYN